MSRIVARLFLGQSDFSGERTSALFVPFLFPVSNACHVRCLASDVNPGTDGIYASSHTVQHYYIIIFLDLYTRTFKDQTDLSIAKLSSSLDQKYVQEITCLRLEHMTFNDKVLGQKRRSNKIDYEIHFLLRFLIIF